MTLAALANEHFRNIIAEDLLRLTVGEMIGEGVYRHVFAWLPDPSLVVKVEDGAGHFCNATEWQVWKAIQYTEHAKWFAPCISISSCGIYLLQKRTQPMTSKQLPPAIPAFFTDTKVGNWGRLGTKAVCHDYGNNLLMELGMTKRMQKAKWWGEST